MPHRFRTLQNSCKTHVAIDDLALTQAPKHQSILARREHNKCKRLPLPPALECESEKMANRKNFIPATPRYASLLRYPGTRGI